MVSGPHSSGGGGARHAQGRTQGRWGRGQGHSHRGRHAGGGPPPAAAAQPFPFPPQMQDRGVKRARECPCATRLYLLEHNDIATEYAVCSAILGVPSTSGLPALACESGSRPVAPEPVSVCMVWPDTTLLELAMEALRVTRAWADAAFEEARAAVEAADRAVPKTGEEEEGAKAAPRVAPSSSLKESRPVAEREKVTPLPQYSVELLCGYVSDRGNTVVHRLGTVELRQVVAGHAGLVFPVWRGRGSVRHDAVATELGLAYGNPVLVSCTRTA